MPVDVFFQPRSVAVIGATEEPGSVGRSLISNLKQAPFRGRVYAVNPRRAAVLDLPCFPNVKQIPEKIDLAVIATPARTVPGVIRDCVEAGVRGAIIISAGFKETGEAGAALEQEVLREARKGNMRIVGPNCLGLMSPQSGSTPPSPTPWLVWGTLDSSVRVALCAPPSWTGASARWSASARSFPLAPCWMWAGATSFSIWATIRQTRSIVIYMESVGDARAFLSAAREVALVEAHHRDQARTHGSRRQGRRIAHRSADRPGRRARRRVSPLRRRPREHHRRAVLSLRSAGQAAAPPGSELDHRDQCGRTGRAGHRRACWPTAAA